jgi:hypothetical protein
MSEARQKPPVRLKEAETRRGMVQLNVFVPRAIHRELLRLRERQRIGLNEAVRLALGAWLTARRAKGGDK